MWKARLFRVCPEKAGLCRGSRGVRNGWVLHLGPTPKRQRLTLSHAHRKSPKVWGTAAISCTDSVEGVQSRLYSPAAYHGNIQ